MATGYEKRVVAYFDILGWKRAVSDPAQEAAVRFVADYLSKVAAGHTKRGLEQLRKLSGMSELPDRFWENQSRVQLAVFSDNVGMSAAVEFGEQTLLRASALCRWLLGHGFLTRGGIACGDLHQDENVILGPALNEAVALEKEAHMPRLLCSPEVVKFVRESSYPAVHLMVVKDLLGRDVLNLYPYVHGTDERSMPWLKRASTEEAFARGAERAAGNAAHAEKWNYARALADEAFSTPPSQKFSVSK